MNKQIVLLLLSCSVFGQDITTVTNNQTVKISKNSSAHDVMILKKGARYEGEFLGKKSDKVHFKANNFSNIFKPRIKEIKELNQDGKILIKDGKWEAQLLVPGDNIEKLASNIINNSNHHASPGIIDSPFLITLAGFPTSFVVAEGITPKSWKPEGVALTIFSGFLGAAIWKYKEFNNFHMKDERGMFLDATSDSDIEFAKRSAIFAERLGELAAYRSIARHKFHMNPLRRNITNYVVTMPAVFILFNIAPISVLAYPFVMPRLYDKYIQKTYFNKKKKNYLASIPEHEHEIFSSKYNPIINEYSSNNRVSVLKKDASTQFMNSALILSGAGVIAIILVGALLSSITLG